MENNMKNLYLYTRYERLWHWLQTAFILILLVTGFEVHDNYSLIGFANAVEIHRVIGITWLIAFFFFVFWLFTTGEWRQYIPTTKKVIEVMKYYMYGIFLGKSHPVPKRKDAKHNPLQRIIYLVLAALLLPFQMITGFLYWGYNSWPAWNLEFLPISLIAFLHILGSFALLSFVIVHVYMTTTGHSIFAHTKAMITGWEEVREGELADWEKKKH